MTQKPINEHQASLIAKLEKPQLSAIEVCDGIRQCFMCCQLLFMRERNPNISDDEVNRLADELVREVFNEEGLTVDNVTPRMLLHVIYILDRRFEFMQDPALRDKHLGVMEMLISRLEGYEDPDFKLDTERRADSAAS